MDLSIIISYHQEGLNFIKETINLIQNTIDISDYEIIVVDDYSDRPIKLEGVKVIRHVRNYGVGAAFDTGIGMAQSDNIWWQGADIRFASNNWASKMIKALDENPKSLICTSVVHLSAGTPDLTFEMSRENFVYNGATILMAYGDEERNILKAQWLPRESRLLKRGDELARKMLLPYGVHYSDTECYEVPCILGAAYGVKKSWYNHIDGFWGHIKWGTLEPYISLKSWLFGGNCMTAPHIETGHIFNDTQGRHGYKDLSHLAYNSMLVAWLLFNNKEREYLVNQLIPHDFVIKGKEMINEKLPEILVKRDEYKAKNKMTVDEFITRFNLKFL
jgi:glycosyltransferase involved in cell wall biosynthesis